MATEDRRSLGILHIGATEEPGVQIEAADLLAIVAGSMSSELCELTNRSDQSAVVWRTHERPRSVEDCVRAMIIGVPDRYDDLPSGTLVSARQESFATSHGHTAVAERADLLGRLRAEAASGRPASAQTTLRAWLDAR